ncbi:hypothetical protein A5893_13175 [Pedobacter psychrophilus]|uniref:histidine kinase n=1 Tax=Pedobacter psychrophilus TaxID=1826909 RepID=A0A179DDK4_9SPHI|nr:hybrid sensor histidine kinase/response regulator transcription factor [Pedobacter psychrophilus]OAQ38984.1 hypothetical protein A5893_13175 [Pedobacter psychrophilus]
MFYSKKIILRFLITISFLMLFSQLETFAQIDKIKFNFLTREQGISNSTVVSIFQDSKGYIWFGSGDGLNVYDGYTIKVYKNLLNDPNSLSSNNVTQIIEDNEQRIWVGTTNGLNIYNRKTDEFLRFKIDNQSKTSINSNNIISLFLDRKGVVWVGTDYGLNKYNKATNNFERFSNKNYTSGFRYENSHNCIYQDFDGNLLIGTPEAGILKFNTKKQNYQSFGEKDKLLSNLKGLDITVIIEDLQRNIWIGTFGNGVYVLNYKDGSLKNFSKENGNTLSLSSNEIKSIICDKNNNIWIGTENGGVNIKPSNSNTFLRYENDLKNPYSFSSKTASSILEDNQENIWIGTFHGKINVYSPKLANFKIYTKGVGEGALTYSDVKAFIEISNNEIWVGTDGGGINVYNDLLGKFTQFRHSPKNPKSIGSDAILSFMKDKNNQIWISTWGGGLNKYNSTSKDFTKYKTDSKNLNAITSNYIYDSYQDKSGLIWVATFYSGINTFDPKSEKFKRILYSPDKNSQFNGIFVTSINEDKKGNLWFSTVDGGLNCLNKQRTKFTHFFDKKNEEISDPVRTIFNDSKERLWVGKKGLYLFNYQTKKFNLFSNHPTLVNEIIQSIIEDRKGNLWMGTNNGLIQYHPDTKFIKHFGPEDGLLGLEFSPKGAMITNKGEMFFGGLDGFNKFYPEKIRNPKFSFPIYITDFTIFNKSINKGPNKTTVNKYIEEDEAISINYDQSIISFEFAALNYITPKKTNYAYKLEGFDEDWNYVNKERKATYTNLDPGEYTFYVKASSPDGLWNTKPTSMKLVVVPPFYLTWWFKLFIVMLVGASIFVLLYLKRKQELRIIHEENKEKLHQFQLQFFTNISHEFRTPLSLIIGTVEQIFKLNSNSAFSKYYLTINRNANRLLQLVSELMDFRKVESGVLKLKVMKGNFSPFLNEVTEDFKQYALQRNIDFKVNQDDLSEIWFDRQVCEKILLNLLNNSFKYSQEHGEINVEVKSTLDNFKPKFDSFIKKESEFKGKEYLNIIITDTGIGMAESDLNHLFEAYYRVSDTHLGTGIGLAFVRSLVLLHKSNIAVYSEIDKGTQIIINIPCSQDDYDKDEIWSPEIHLHQATLESVNFKEAFNTIGHTNGSINNHHKTDNNKPRILLVEDNEEIRGYFREILESEYDIIEAEDGEKGLLKAKNESPILIISDVMMPVMDGITFCNTIKNDFETSHIPFILLTAKDAIESRIQGAESGADYYFSKPVNTELLILTIRNQLKQQQKIKERYLKDYQVEARDLVNNAKDKKFMDQILKAIEDKLEDPELNIDYLINEIGVSKTKLYKKIKDITGQSSNEFVRTIRLKKAMDIMIHEDVSVNEVMYRVGISSHSYFSAAFKKEFGTTPSNFQKQLNVKKEISEK